MSINQRIGLLVPFIMMLGAVLACDFVQKMGALSANNQPIMFNAKGERVQIWQAEVEISVTYEVTVSPQNVTGQHDGASIIICERSGDICPEYSMLSSISTLRNGATIRFVSPKASVIYIHVSASIGEKQEDLGTFQIALRRV